MSSHNVLKVLESKVKATIQQVPPSNPEPSIFNRPSNFAEFFVAQVATLVLVYSAVKIVVSKMKNNPMVKIGLAILEPVDIELQDELDNLAQSIREIAKADRAIVAFFHNGEYNSILHFKKYTIMAESYKKGLVSIKQENQGRMIGDFLTKDDLEMYEVHKANDKFVEVTIDSPCFSMKRKAALLEVGISRSLDRFLLDELTDKAFGFVSLQYYSLPQRDYWLSCFTTPQSVLPKNSVDEIENYITRLHSFVAAKINNS
ncbi:MAG: hypothetical protein ACRDBG_00595, partial [Waterburya sp.]